MHGQIKDTLFQKVKFVMFFLLDYSYNINSLSAISIIYEYRDLESSIPFHE